MRERAPNKFNQDRTRGSSFTFPFSISMFDWWSLYQSLCRQRSRLFFCGKNSGKSISTWVISQSFRASCVILITASSVLFSSPFLNITKDLANVLREVKRLYSFWSILLRIRVEGKAILSFPRAVICRIFSPATESCTHAEDAILWCGSAESKQSDLFLAFPFLSSPLWFQDGWNANLLLYVPFTSVNCCKHRFLILTIGKIPTLHNSSETAKLTSPGVPVVIQKLIYDPFYLWNKCHYQWKNIVADCLRHRRCYLSEVIKLLW